MTAPFEIEEPESAELTPEQLAAMEAPPALPPLHCFPLKVEWERARPVERSGHPAPAVMGAWESFDRLPRRITMPEPVLKLAELAREAGWEVRYSYARGNGVHGATGRPTAVRHNIAVSFGRHPMTDAQAVATYVKAVAGSGAWSWESIWMWGPALPHFGLCGLAELKHWLTEETPATWYEDVRARVAGVADAKAKREARDKTIKAEHALMLERRPEGMSIEVARHEAAVYLATMSLCEGLSVEDVLRIVKPKRARKDHGD